MRPLMSSSSSSSDDDDDELILTALHIAHLEYERINASGRGKGSVPRGQVIRQRRRGAGHSMVDTKAMEKQATPPSATAAVDLSPAATDLGRVHLLPCGIRHNSTAAVSDYFKPRDTGVEVDGVRVEEAFFRGRKLHGATVTLPDGYRGYVLEKKSGGKDTQSVDGEVSNFVSRAEFQNVTYWNHDTMPSAEDSLPRCFHWLTIANAMHKPVTAEELANMSAMQNQNS